MFGSVALDVFIGLVLIYLLYSLLISIIGEMLSTWFGLRARILRMAIELMLNDNDYYSIKKDKLWKWIRFKIQKFFLNEFDEFKSSLAGKFYSQPSIKYLARGDQDKKGWFDQRKPSYFSNVFFADTLINMLGNKGDGTTDIEKIAFCLKFNTLHIQTETLKNLNNFLSNSGNDINQFREKLKSWFDETNDRANGWYKRKMQFILFWLGFLLAVCFNVDSIQIAKSLSKDKEARNKLVDMGIQLSKDSLRYNQLVDSNRDTIITQAAIDSGYAHVTQDISDANYILGLGWSLQKEFEDTIYNDSLNAKLYFSLLRLNKLKEVEATLNDTISSAIFIHDSLKGQKLDLEYLKFQLLYQGQNDSSLSDSIIKIDSLLIHLGKQIEFKDSLIKKDSVKLVLNQENQLILRHKIKLTENKRFVAINSIDKNESGNYILIKVREDYSAWEKLLKILSYLISFWTIKYWGFVFTALAISLGAPFWFDLLRKLIALRGAGVKPEERLDADQDDKILRDTNGFPAIKIPFQNQVHLEPEEEALNSLTEKLLSETQIVSVGLESNDNQTYASIAVHVESNGIIPYLQNKYGILQNLNNGKTIPVTYSIAGKIAPHSGKCGGEIGNASKTLGLGTLGCYLSAKGSTDKFLLSCWHVLKDNSNWSQAPIQNSIVDRQGKEIAIIREGFISDKLDIGIASCNNENDFSNSALPIKSQHRPVTAFDSVNKTKVKYLGMATGSKSATIFHHKVNAVLHYEGEEGLRCIYDTFCITTKDAQGNPISPTLSGDSGAIVIDENNVPLGMIIGGNDKLSYAIKFTNAFDDNKIHGKYSFITS